MTRIILISMLFIVSLAACGGQGQATAAVSNEPSPLPDDTSAPDIEAEPAASPTPEATVSSFEGSLYRDAEAGFSFDLPYEWEQANDAEEYARGEIIQFYKEGEPVFTVSKLRWDPQNNLEAYIDSRLTAWQNSGVDIVSDETLAPAGGAQARRFIVEGLDGQHSLFYITLLGDRYLVLSGTGDLELLKQVTNSLRFSQIES